MTASIIHRIAMEMPAFFLIYNDQRKEIPLGEFLIGRGSDCNLTLNDASVSRVHAVLINSGEKLFVMDKESRNGVIVNGERILAQRQINDGDELEIGHQKIYVFINHKAFAESTRIANDADRTVGIRTCEACGQWTNSNDTLCSSCGANIGSVRSNNPTDTFEYREASFKTSKHQSVLIEQHPIAAMASLALKAIAVGKKEEAERLLFGALKSNAVNLEIQSLLDSDFEALSGALLEYAIASKSAEHISILFKLHLQGKRLMSRELVEGLYQSVRKINYLSCPDMANYLAYLNSIVDDLNAGERFVHRRLEGLVKICS